MELFLKMDSNTVPQLESSKNRAQRNNFQGWEGTPSANRESPEVLLFLTQILQLSQGQTFSRLLQSPQWICECSASIPD
jgi:hypothetical protein